MCCSDSFVFLIDSKESGGYNQTVMIGVKYGRGNLHYNNSHSESGSELLQQKSQRSVSRYNAWPVWICIAVFLAAAYMLAGSAKDTNPKFSWKTVVLLVGTFVLNGVTMLCQKTVTYIDPDSSISLFSRGTEYRYAARNAGFFSG